LKYAKTIEIRVLKMVRLGDDAREDVNPRAYFWNQYENSFDRTRVYGFSFHRFLTRIGQQYATRRNVVFYHWNHHMETTGMYVPNRFKVSVKTHIIVFGSCIILGSIAQSFEYRLWKERKWDKEPGGRVPMRKHIIERAYNSLVNYYLRPFMYKHAIRSIEKDFTPLELEHFSGGR
jgi:hypothetical protein